MSTDSHPETVLIENGIVLTVDESNRVIPDGAVLLAGEEIAAVGDPDEIRAETRIDRRVDASGKAILPGLVD
ncbi:MAG: hypothetical protein ABEJ60_00595, partial [Halodesulfurarchaeum sp.]